MRSTLVGIFDDRLAAERARTELLRAGFADDEVDLRTGAQDRAWHASDDRLAADDQSEATVGETIGDWFRSLFGIDDDEDVGIYTEAVRRGESIVTVRAADEDRVDHATDILEACGSIDIDEKADEWRAQGWAQTSATSDRKGAPTTTASTTLGASAATAIGAAPAGATGATTGAASMQSAGDGVHAGDELRPGETRKVPIIEEQLRVGKRIVGQRRLRVYTRMVDEPVQENVRLTEERVHIDRRDADRPATEADYRAAAGARSIDATERSEEAVVGKDARVVGEVEIGKEKHERQETVRDTVRHTDVKVEKRDAAGRPDTPDAAGRPDTPDAGRPDTPDAPPPPNVRR